MSRYSFYSPYVPVAERRRQALKKLRSLSKNGVEIEPLGELSHRMKIATSFWGRGWCEHLESFSDYSNRLPRGRTYVRNGSVAHLSIKPGVIEAYVQGSELYKETIKIKQLPSKKWEALQARCRGKIGSLIELLQGKISGEIMSIVTDKNEGLFPNPDEIEFNCSCPDWASMCKHIASVLYGVGARLDKNPELLFTLRGVDHTDLISGTDRLEAPTSAGRRRRMDSGSLGEVFGIELDTPGEPSPPPGKSFKPTAAFIRKMRQESGLSKYAFAKAIGVSASAIDVWESKKGALKLQARTLDRLRGYHQSLPGTK